MTAIEIARFRNLTRYFVRQGDFAKANVFQFAVNGDASAKAEAEAIIRELDQAADRQMARARLAIVCKQIRETPEIRWEEVR